MLHDTHQARHVVARALGVGLLLAMGLIHVLDMPSKFNESAPIGVLYVVGVVAAFIAAGLLVHSDTKRGWILALVTGSATLVGYILSRTTGLPTATGDIGNWLEPLGLASLFVEGTLMLLSGYALAISGEPIQPKDRFMRVERVPIG